LKNSWENIGSCPNTLIDVTIVIPIATKNFLNILLSVAKYFVDNNYESFAVFIVLVTRKSKIKFLFICNSKINLVMCMFRRTFFLSLLCISNGIFAQDTLERAICWNYRQVPTAQAEQTILWFDNAVYTNPQTMIPSYFELIPIENNGAYNSTPDVLVADEQWVLVANDEMNLLQGVNNFINESVDCRTAIQRGRMMIQLTVPAVRLNSDNKFEKLVSFKIILKRAEKTNDERSYAPARLQVKSSVLSSGSWVRVSVREGGVYKISYNDLQSYGLSNLENVSLWGNGGHCLPYMNSEQAPDDLNPIPILMSKGDDGIFNQGDYILFYAEGPKTFSYNATMDMWEEKSHPYAQQISYFITTSLPQSTIETLEESAAPLNRTANSYDAFLTIERNDTNMVKSGREWFGDVFDLTTSRTYTTDLSLPVVGSPLKVWLRAAARSSVASNFTVKANTTTLGTLPLNSVVIGDEYADVVAVNEQVYTSALNEGNLTIELTYSKPNSTATGLLDFITINTRQQLKYNGSQLIFRDKQSVGSGNITEFSILNSNQNVQVWDITSFNHPYRLNSRYSGGVVAFKQATDTLRHFIAFEPEKAKTVTFVGAVANQNIHGAGQPDFVIVAHPLFMPQAQELAQLHRSLDGLDVVVFSTDEVYNEFSSGNPDLSAIRNMMRYFYRCAATTEQQPKYLLLFGDGSYDNLSDRNGNTNYILTYQSPRSINKVGSFQSDDYFGLLDDEEGEAVGLLDVGVGRLPVSTTEQANAVLAKIQHYVSGSNTGDWQSKLCFIGDDEDGNIHMTDANTLADYLSTSNPEYNIQKIFFDAYRQESSSGGASYPEVTNAINTTVNNGVFLVNYTGHGNERWLAHEKVLMLSDVSSWKNTKQLPLFVTATCEFSRFDDYHLTSTGEQILLSPDGGGIALVSTTRLVYSSPNFTLNYKFINNLFKFNEDSTSHYRLGDLIKISKNLSGTGNNKRNFTLLGDPALMLRYPELGAEITSINGKPVDEEADTLKALSVANLSGRIFTPIGQVASDFSGNATITVFDKKSEIKTLANDGGMPMTFFSWDNVLYKGRAIVNNGLFSIDFVVPKDIRLSFGTGRISIFADDLARVAMGYNESVIVGGVFNSPYTDNEGPEIDVYLNDTLFNGGGISDSSPKLLIRLRDESGINTSGIGIGHDLTATLTSPGGDEVNVILNMYYQSEPNSYQEGYVNYQLADLSEGRYWLRVKAWDTYNNSSEKIISFVVVGAGNLQLEKFYSYPNPFSEGTSFYFEHNMPEDEFNLTIQIFDVAGRLVSTITQSQAYSGGYRVGPIYWNGTDSRGSRLGRGIYICRLSVKTSSGYAASLQHKLVILR